MTEKTDETPQGHKPAIAKDLSPQAQRALREAEERRRREAEAEKVDMPDRPRELDGPKGKEPTRYGDWERAGRCYDFS
jgi:hypothetical protein